MTSLLLILNNLDFRPRHIFGKSFNISISNFSFWCTVRGVINSDPSCHKHPTDEGHILDTTHLSCQCLIFNMRLNVPFIRRLLISYFHQNSIFWWKQLFATFLGAVLIAWQLDNSHVFDRTILKFYTNIQLLLIFLHQKQQIF